jgi:biotin transport system substrate-specific component
MVKPLSVAGVRLFGIILFAVALARAPHIAIPLPLARLHFSPRPTLEISLQPILVILAGMFLGPLAGVASVMLYLAGLTIKLPVFVPTGAPPARLFGIGGVSLLAYAAAAYIAGALTRRAINLGGRWIAAVASTAVIIIAGSAHLTIYDLDYARFARFGKPLWAAILLVYALVQAFVAAAISGLSPQVRLASRTDAWQMIDAERGSLRAP